MRIRILLGLDAPTVSPSELAERLAGSIPLATLAYHFRILRERGVLELAETVPVRGATENFYRLTPLGRGLRDLIPVAGPYVRNGG